MFDRLKSLIQGVFGNMIGRQDIKDAFHIDAAMTTEMENAIALWAAAYRGEAPWQLESNAKSLNLPVSISKEIARLVTVEFSSEVSNDPWLNEQYQKVTAQLRNRIQRGIALGGMIFKPYLVDGEIAIDYVPEGYFVPTRYRSTGEITGLVLPEYKTIGEYTFTRLEHHEFDKQAKTYTIENRAYKKYQTAADHILGTPCPLTDVEGWEDLQPKSTYTNIYAPLFSYFRMPGDNIIDSVTPLGVSIYADALPLIEDADQQYSRIDWEYTAKEAAIDVDRSAIMQDPKGRPIYPTGKERLFRTLDFGTGIGDTYHVYDPPIRDASLYNGLNEILRRIEFSCCLAYGTLSDPNDIERTATEINSSRQRSFSLVKDTQMALQRALEGLIEAINCWAQIGGIQRYNPKPEITFNWDDSIVIDKQTELAAMQADVAAGILKPELYLMKKYGVSEKEALDMMPKKENPIETLLQGAAAEPEGKPPDENKTNGSEA